MGVAEYARVRRLYAKLGISGKTQIEFFEALTRSMESRPIVFSRGPFDWHPDQ
ncbi:MAG: hypothetical protein CM1200mP2_20750 [Planctomycetaceae bacterium]|nr:MAG: hypothetical protein CM1200mP2_20750 [Planctomycetaceae bacterium]